MAETKVTTKQILDVHSNTEQAIGTWVDGSTIYRKSWEKGGAADYSFAHGISNLNRFIKIQIQGDDDAYTNEDNVHSTKSIDTYFETRQYCSPW